jgi:hypothetical protein
MNPSVFIKQPWEKRQIKVDFSDSLLSGDTISSINSVTAWLDGVNKSDDIIYGVPTYVGNKVYVVLMGGTNGLTYNIRFRVGSSGGDLIEDDLNLTIREKS